MSDQFAIPTPNRLPLEVTPCPIVEAILEVRFVTEESWRTLPGLLYAKIRDRYPEQRDLDLAAVPEEVRRHQAAFASMPLMQFLGADFLIQFGPRVLSLVTRPNRYPGWTLLEAEMKWLISQMQSAGFVGEGERLGVRYVNFFSKDVFEHLLLSVSVGERPLAGGETSVSTVLRKKPFSARLLVANSAILPAQTGPVSGSVLDIDVWLGPLDFDLFTDGLDRIRQAHHLEKEIFFGLLTPAFLEALNPRYS